MLVNLSNRLKHLVATLIFVGLFGIASPVLASTYGSSSYNKCNYDGLNCTTASTTANAAATTDLDTSTTFEDGTGSSSEVSEGTVLHFTLITDSSDNSSRNVANSNTARISHTITVNKITADSVVITIASTPKQYTLKLLEPLLVDLTGDSINDIGVEATTITPPTATLKVWRIPYVAPSTAAAAGSTTPTNSKVTPAWKIIAAVASLIAVLLILPRRFFDKIFHPTNKPQDHSKHGGKDKTGGLIDHIPGDREKEHHNPLLPAHDLHSQAGVVENDEEIINEDETGKPITKQIIVDNEQFEDIPPPKQPKG